MELKHIAPAFVRAKRAFSPAIKNSNNPHFRSKYADLAACIEAVDDALLANGIVLYQETFENETGVTVETVLLHESGETLRCGKLHVPAPKQDPQGYGSALSYARRYSLMAACGIAPEDDDGNAASKPRKATAPAQAISAPAECFRALDDDTQRHLRQIAQIVTGAMPDGARALDLLEEAGLDNDQRAGLWYLLDSATRSALKAAKAVAA